MTVRPASVAHPDGSSSVDPATGDVTPRLDPATTAVVVAACRMRSLIECHRVTNFFASTRSRRYCEQRGRRYTPWSSATPYQAWCASAAGSSYAERCG